MTETPSIRNGLQRCENLRNSLGLNYKSAALFGGATGAELAETRVWTEATLYLSTPGVGSISRLLPCISLSWFVTIGPFCNELIDRRSWPRLARLPRISRAAWRD